MDHLMLPMKNLVAQHKHGLAAALGVINWLSHGKLECIGISQLVEIHTDLKVGTVLLEAVKYCTLKVIP